MTAFEIMKLIKDNHIIILIFILGLTLRIYDLGKESIWYDEAFTENISKQSILPLINSVLSNGGESNPPIYYILLHYWTLVFGNSEYSLRFMSALFGSFSIFAIYALGKELFNKRAGLIAALILSLSVFHIYYSQEARAYTLMSLLTIISFYTLIKLADRWTYSYAILYIISSILMLYSHYYAIFIVGVQNIFVLTIFLMKRKAGEISIWKWIIMQLVLGAVFIPGLIHLLLVTSTIKESFWIPKPSLEFFSNTFVRYNESIYLFVLFVIFALLAVFGLRRVGGLQGFKTFLMPVSEDSPKSAIGQGYKLYLLALWFLVPILIPVLYSIVSTPMFVPRYGIVAIPAFYLLASVGIAGLRSRWHVAAICLVIVLLSIPNIADYFSSIKKAEFREVVFEIESSAADGDIIVLEQGQWYLPFNYYQTREDFNIMQLKDKFPSFKNLGSKSVWVLMTANPEYRKYIRDGLGKSYNFEMEKNFTYLDLYRLRSK